MSYIEDSLGPDEKVVYRAHFNWLWKARGWVVLLAALGGAGFLYAHANPLVAIIIAGIGFILFLWLLVPIWTTEVGLTNERLIYKRGFLYRDTKEIQLRAVEEAALAQSVWGRLFNFGQITVHGTGGEDLQLPVLADPITIRRLLEEALTQVGRRLGAYASSAKA
jgi:uncharacterized membrane protein YdbT with pleckstrin-like domain